MPAFETLLSDDEIARSGNFSLQKYDNANPPITTKQVAQLHAGGAPSPLFKQVRYGASAVAVLLLLLYCRKQTEAASVPSSLC